MGTGPESESGSNIEEEQPAEQLNEQTPKDTILSPPKRGPGRPRKTPIENTPPVAKRGRGRPRKHPLPATDTSIADVTVFIQEATFENSRRSEINGLLEKGIFEPVDIGDVPQGTRIFNSRFVDKIKHLGTDKAFKKSRLVVQAYNDQGKDLVLTQSPTIQRVSQRIILALVPTLQQNQPATAVYLRDISQAYVQATTHLNREIFIRPPPKLGLSKNTTLRVVKPLYGVPEAGNHWFRTYHQYHIQELKIAQSTYNPCLLHTSTNGFGLVGLQTDDTLFLADPEFVRNEEAELQKAKFLAKDREQLTTEHPIKFNGG